MINKPIQVFKLMYIALTKEWEKEKDEKLGLYLSESDPFVTGDDSVDPVVFEDFKKKFEDSGTYDDFGYDFIAKYLLELDPFYGDVKKYFDRIDRAQFVSDSEKYSSMSDEELIDMFHLYEYEDEPLTDTKA